MWSILSELGKKVCVLNVPFTYPPDRVNGVMVSGMDTPNLKSNFIYPGPLRAELDKATGGYLLESGVRDIRDRVEQYTRSIFEVTENRFRAAKFLIKKDDWDLFAMVFEATDRAQHNYWHYMDRQHPGYSEEGHKQFGKVIFDTYKDIDARIGELMKLIPEDAVKVILSDHGFGPLYKGVRLNKWLELNGFLEFKSEGGVLKSGLAEKTRSFFKKGLHKISNGRLSSGAPKLLANLNMEKTRVYTVGGPGNICINLKGRQPSGTVEPGGEYEALRDELISKLRGLKDPATGKTAVAGIYKREEIYSVFPDFTPDLLISWVRGYYNIGENELNLFGLKAGPDDLFTGHNWSGNHNPDGILILNGGEIKEGYRIKGAEITDVAPTIFYLMDCAIPDDMDGHVLSGAIKAPYADTHEKRYTKTGGPGEPGAAAEKEYSKEEEQEVSERLRALGYLE